MAEYVEIKLKGHLDRGLSAWFPGLMLFHLDGDITLLAGPIPDQAALHGMLEHIRDFNLNLISVTSSRVIHRDDSAKRQRRT